MWVGKEIFRLLQLEITKPDDTGKRGLSLNVELQKWFLVYMAGISKNEPLYPIFYTKKATTLSNTSAIF